jgi:hypothetical protein
MILSEDDSCNIGMSNSESLIILKEAHRNNDYRWCFRVKACASAVAHGGSCGQGRLTQTRFARGMEYLSTVGQCVLHVKRMHFFKRRTWILSIADPTSTLEREPNSSADIFPTTVAERDDCQKALMQKL